MRFFADGPILPDDLLLARDEGQVLFFCGAGVSRARAGLPDFASLARAVVDGLRSAQDSPARQLLKWTEEQGRVDGRGSLTPTDRIFSHLEREFPSGEVRAAVARQLKPATPTDLSAHEILLDLAKGPDGEVRLVTTNFDLLFEAVNPHLDVSAPPSLPNPLREREFKGIVHLHGRVTDGYNGAFNEGLVLSSADFGRAYLSEAWATSFIAKLLTKYKLVFVGYAADDPPVQYLLEALNTTQPYSGGLYAFQDGTNDAATALWAHKGVQAIAFVGDDNFSRLWDTLAAWAMRARDPGAWYEAILATAMAGPAALHPFQRGQVKHVISTAAGARRFALQAPPAEWMCVFDDLARYHVPPISQKSDERPDLFGLYGLDDDPLPPAKSGDRYNQAETPPGAWNVFEVTKLDRIQTQNGQFGGFRGTSSQTALALVDRHAHLGAWFSHVSNQPAAVWWAAGQAGLHPYVQSQIWRRVEAEGMNSTIRRAWDYILHSWSVRGSDPDHASFALEAQIRQLGWSRQRTRAWVLAIQPWIKIRRPLMSAPPRASEDDIRLDRLISVSFEFPFRNLEIDIPASLFPLYVSEERRSLEIALDAQNEYYGDCVRLPTLNRPQVDDNQEFQNDIETRFLCYAKSLEKLATSDITAFRQEIGSWPFDVPMYSRLRVWISGSSQMTTATESGKLLLSLKGNAFWSPDGRRDLLMSVARRWASIPKSLRQRLEQRLLKGPPRWNKKVSTHEYRRHQAHEILNCISWLVQHGCTFSFDLDAARARYFLTAPDWREEFGEQAADSTDMVVGSVTVDTSTRGLENVPPARLLEVASQFQSREWGSFVEHRPLAGIAKRQPILILRALALEARRGGFAVQAWKTLLQSEARAGDSPKLMRQLARRLGRLTPSALASIVNPASEWLLQCAVPIQASAEAEFSALWNAFILALRDHPDSTHAAQERSGGVDWAAHSLNAPAGKLAQVLMKGVNTLSLDAELPSIWCERAEQLLSLVGDARRDALAILAFHLPSISCRNPSWSERELFALLDTSAHEDRRALWAGMFRSGQIPYSPKLFLRIKPALLTLTQERDEALSNNESIALFLLLGWRIRLGDDLSRIISDNEMRQVLLVAQEGFRARVLWQLPRLTAICSEQSNADSLYFLQNVWPRQSSIRSSAITVELINFAFISATSRERFASAVDTISPLVTSLSANSWVLQEIQYRQDLDKNNVSPKALLALLGAILTERAADWPHGATAFVERLLVEPEVAGDPSLLRLQIKMANR